MPQDWRLEINRLIILLVAAGIIGNLVGSILLGLLIALLLYLAYVFYQLNKLDRWLRSLAADLDAVPPDGTGFWGILFDGIYRLQRGERQANKELQHILSRAQKSVAALDIGVILIDKKSTLEWWNGAAETLVGIRFPEDRGQSATNLIRHPRFKQFFTRENYDEPLIINSPVNSNIMLELKITLFGEQDKLMIVRDITQVHKLELMRKDFVGNVSHELRTPITVISGYLETLVENRQLLNTNWHKPLQQMHQQSKRMENIVRDLLILSRLETKAISLQQSRIDVTQLLNEIRNDTLNIYPESAHSIRIECPEALTLTGDRSELYSAVSNLVFNAAKYTPEGGEIVLAGVSTAVGIEISVEDNGIGIEAQHIPRITERFYRVDVSRSSDTGGTGLGLAIVKHILMRHGATLHISSTPGKGSCFMCRFSYRETASVASTVDAGRKGPGED